MYSCVYGERLFNATFRLPTSASRSENNPLSYGFRFIFPHQPPPLPFFFIPHRLGRLLTHSTLDPDHLIPLTFCSQHKLERPLLVLPPAPLLVGWQSWSRSGNVGLFFFPTSRHTFIETVCSSDFGIQSLAVVSLVLSLVSLVFLTSRGGCFCCHYQLAI